MFDRWAALVEATKEKTDRAAGEKKENTDLLPCPGKEAANGEEKQNA